jgi:glycosyltransferase 2 family protein
MIATSEPIPPLPPRTKVRRYFFLLIVLGLSLYFLLPQFARIQHALQVASTLKIRFTALALGAQVLSYLGSGYLLRALVGPMGKQVSIADGAMMTAGANSIGTLGGGVLGTAGMTYLWLRQRGVGPGTAGLGGWIPIFLNDATLALVSLAGLLTLILVGKTSSILILGFALAVLILGGGIGIFLWCVTHRQSMTPAAIAIATLAARFRRKAIDPNEIQLAVGRLLQAWDALLEGGWMRPATGAVLNTGFDLLTLAFLFISAGHGVSPLVLIAGYGVPQLLGKLTVILGGIGVVETTMVGLYSVLGVPTAISVVVILVYRLLSFWIPTLVGIALVPYFEHWKA